MTVKILFISDLHETGENNHEQVKWLYGIVKRIKPDIVLSSGDWDVGISSEVLWPILKITPLLTIFGNHENMEELRKLYSPVLNRPVLLSDFEVIKFGDLVISGVNGIYSKKRLSKKGVPRQQGDSFVRKAKKFVEKTKVPPHFIDVFLCHETPELPVYIERKAEHLKFRMFEGSKLILDVINMIKPKLVLNGHLHFSSYTLSELPYGGLYVRVDSSRKHRGFAVIKHQNSVFKISVYERGVENKVDEATMIISC